MPPHMPEFGCLLHRFHRQHFICPGYSHATSAPVYDTYQVQLQHPVVSSCPPSCPPSHATSPPLAKFNLISTLATSPVLWMAGLSCIDDTAPIYLSDTTHVDPTRSLHAYAGTATLWGRIVMSGVLHYSTETGIWNGFRCWLQLVCWATYYYGVQVFQMGNRVWDPGVNLD